MAVTRDLHSVGKPRRQTAHELNRIVFRAVTDKAISDEFGLSVDGYPSPDAADNAFVSAMIWHIAILRRGLKTSLPDLFRRL
jgi:hypothetical protein